jgi:uncharacterized membrane protein YeaQ/YmgE (transglycosylase-associated protein family)
MFADIAMMPGYSWISWIVAGLIAGWLAGLAMRGSGYGIIWDIVLGLIGALIGGFVCSLFVTGQTGFWGTVVVAFIGACILVAIGRALSPRSTV